MMSGAGEHGGGIPGFENLSRIGSGGSSTVYQAVDVRHQRTVAVKVLDQQAADDGRRSAFHREVEAIARVGSHPNVVALFGSGFTSAGHPYLVLPLFSNGTYSELVDEQGPLTWSAAVDVGVKLCSAVETVHRAGVVHRDIKPGNVFVGVTPEHPLLADFGISSTVAGEATRTETSAVTFGYSAPEVLEGERPTTASDIYSLAMTIYRLIQGLHAYYAETPAAIVRKIMADVDLPAMSAGVPDDLAAVVGGALSKDPVGRPVSALDLGRRLQAVQERHGLPVTGMIVAGEAPILDVGDDGDAGTAISTSVIETTMVEALADRRRATAPRPAIGARPAGEDEISVAVSEPDVRPGDRPDAGAILADAINVSAEETAVGGSATADGVVDSGSTSDEVGPSGDLATVFTPRQPRLGRRAAGTSADQSSVSPSILVWVVGAVLVLLLLVAAAVAILGVLS